MRRLSWLSFRPRKLRIPYALVLHFVTACILNIWLECSSVFSPDLTKILAENNERHVRGFHCPEIFDACNGFLDRVLSDSVHCLQHRCPRIFLILVGTVLFLHSSFTGT